MRCYECGGNYVDHHGDLELHSITLGNFLLKNVAYSKCGQCGEILLPDETWRLADQSENQQLAEFLQNLPVKDFIGAARAAEILGITRQALHKNRRIKRGFIYSIIHDGQTLYHRASVVRFGEIGDGRVPIQELPVGPEATGEYIIKIEYAACRPPAYKTFRSKKARSIWGESFSLHHQRYSYV